MAKRAIQVLEGTVIEVQARQDISQKFSKQEIILQYHVSPDDEYPQEVPITAINDKIDMIDNVNEGDKVKVAFEIKGRKWSKTGQPPFRWFTTLEFVKIQVTEAAPKTVAAPAIENDEDLPF